MKQLFLLDRIDLKKMIDGESISLRLPSGEEVIIGVDQKGENGVEASKRLPQRERIFPRKRRTSSMPIARAGVNLDRITQFVKDNPGCHNISIKDSLKMPSSSVATAFKQNQDRFLKNESGFWRINPSWKGD